MIRALLLCAAVSLTACTGAPIAVAETAPEPAPAWRSVDPDNLILIVLPTGTVAIELFPEAAPAHAARLRGLVADGFYDGEYFYRVVEGHVAQAGREFDPAIGDIAALPFEAERAVSAEGFTPHGNADLFAREIGHRAGFPVGRQDSQEWLLNCPGALGMARDDAPDTGATEFYIPLQPRRYLDRNYVIFGRVIDGIEHVHRLPRVNPFTEEETEALYGDDAPLAYQMTQYRRSTLGGNFITSAQMAAAIPEPERPAYEVMETASAEWDTLKTSRRDFPGVTAFVAPPVNMLDICTLPVPVRRVDGG